MYFYTIFSNRSHAHTSSLNVFFLRTGYVRDGADYVAKHQKKQKILLCAAFHSIGSARLADFSQLIVRCIAGAEGIK
jgi:hypothetical protein